MDTNRVAENTADKMDVVIDKLDRIISILEDMALYEEMMKINPWPKVGYESWP